MLDGQRFPFTERTDSQGRSHVMPYLPLILTILDTGARVNVLPNEIGIQLGAVWKNKTVSIPLRGNLARGETRGLVLSGTVANFSPVLLAFAWS